MAAQSPFKFLDAYTREDHAFFFGRHREVEELYQLIFRSRIVLLYGPSGVGKTSLVRCGLANRFHSFQWYDLLIRKGEDLNQSILSQIHKGIKEAKPDMIPSDNAAEATYQLYLLQFRPVYLIIDQFEELFIFGTAEEREQFILFVKDLMARDIPVRLMLVMREEYLAHLSAMEMAIPQLWDYRLRLEPMSYAHVEEVITGTLDHYHVEMGKPETVVPQIIERVSQGKAQGTQLSYLQVYLDRLYREYVREQGIVLDAIGQPLDVDQSVVFSPELLGEAGDLEDVMEKFLAEQVGEIKEALNLEAERLELEVKEVDKATLRILNPLVTKEGTKKPLTHEELADWVIDVPAELLHQGVALLQASRVLRLNDGTYEIAHDTLAQKVRELIARDAAELILIQEVRESFNYRFSIYQNNNGRWFRRGLLKQEDIDYYSPYYKYFNLPEDEQGEDKKEEKAAKEAYWRRSKRVAALRRGGAMVIALLLVLLAFATYQFNEQRIEAGIQRDTARAKEQDARRQKVRAEFNEARADSSAHVADSLRIRADSSAEVAYIQKLAADSSANVADSLKYQALQFADEAEAERDTAERERGIARQERDTANIERARADSLYYLELARALSVKAQQIPTDTLAGKLALQAYYYHRSKQGAPLSSDIYNGLYFALEGLDSAYFLLPDAGQNLRLLLNPNGKVYAGNKQGDILKYLSNEKRWEPVAKLGDIVREIAIEKAENALVYGLNNGELGVVGSPPYRRRTDTPIIALSSMSYPHSFVSGEFNGVGVIRYWKKGRQEKVIQLPSIPHAIVHPPMKNWVSIGIDSGKVMRWIPERDSLGLLFSIPTPKRVTAIAFTPKGDTMAVGTAGGKIYMVPVASTFNAWLFADIGTSVSAMTFNKTGEYFTYGNEKGKVYLLKWRNQTNLPLILNNHPEGEISLSFSETQDGSNGYLYAACKNVILKWPLQMEELAVHLQELMEGKPLTPKERETYGIPFN